VDEIYVFRIIAGVTEEKLRDRFFKLAEPTLKDVIKEGTAHEAAKNILKVLKGSNHASANSVQEKPKYKGYQGSKGKGKQQGSHAQSGQPKDKSDRSTPKFDGSATDAV
jgi:hypothetical protein